MPEKGGTEEQFVSPLFREGKKREQISSCVCVCVREKERCSSAESEFLRERKRERKRERGAQCAHSGACERERVNVCEREMKRYNKQRVNVFYWLALLLILITSWYSRHPQTRWAKLALFFNLVMMSHWYYSSYTAFMHSPAAKSKHLFRLVSVVFFLIYFSAVASVRGHM